MIYEIETGSGMWRQMFLLSTERDGDRQVMPVPENAEKQRRLGKYVVWLPPRAPKR